MISYVIWGWGGWGWGAGGGAVGWGGLSLSDNVILMRVRELKAFKELG